MSSNISRIFKAAALSMLAAGCASEHEFAPMSPTSVVKADSYAPALSPSATIVTTKDNQTVSRTYMTGCPVIVGGEVVRNPDKTVVMAPCFVNGQPVLMGEKIDKTSHTVGFGDSAVGGITGGIMKTGVAVGMSASGIGDATGATATRISEQNTTTVANTSASSGNTSSLTNSNSNKSTTSSTGGTASNSNSNSATGGTASNTNSNSAAGGAGGSSSSTSGASTGAVTATGTGGTTSSTSGANATTGDVSATGTGGAGGTSSSTSGANATTGDVSATGTGGAGGTSSSTSGANATTGDVSATGTGGAGGTSASTSGANSTVNTGDSSDASDIFNGKLYKSNPFAPKIWDNAQVASAEVALPRVSFKKTWRAAVRPAEAIKFNGSFKMKAA